MKRYAAVNLLGDHTIRQIEYEKSRDQTLYGLLILVVLLAVVIAAELFTYTYQVTARPSETPLELKEQYKQQQSQYALIQQRVEKINAAEKEKKPMVETIEKIVSEKPSEVLFTSLQISEDKVNIECFSQKPEIFNLYTESLKGLIHDAQVEKIMATKAESMIKTASIKGDVR